MIILGIESSCDETGAALIKVEGDFFEVLANTLVTQIDIHQATNGVVPEVAARQHVLSINAVIEEAFKKANLKYQDIDLIGVTQGPGLVGSLFIGIEAAKNFSYVLKKPLIGINHLKAHIQTAIFDTDSRMLRKINYPGLALLVSGGHTELVLIKSPVDFEIIGQTGDDAVGESFDKVAKLMNLPYPGGPILAKRALEGNDQAFDLPIPMKNSKDLNFSYSGLKTAVRLVVQSMKLNEKNINDIAASFQRVAVEELMNKTLKAQKKFQAKTIILAGGVAANILLRERIVETFSKDCEVIIPPFYLCTDNGLMIAMAGYLEYANHEYTNLSETWKTITAMPTLNI